MLSIGSFVFILFVFSNMWGQRQEDYNDKIEKQFLSALKMFEQGKYVEAASAFNELAHQKPYHHRTTAASIMEAKANFHLKKYQESIEVLENFLITFPKSEYNDDALYTLGLNYMMLMNYEKACQLFLQVYEVTNDKNILKNAFNLLTTISEERLEVEEIKELLGRCTKLESIIVLTLSLAEKYLQEGEIGKAEENLKSIEKYSNLEDFKDRIKLVWEKIRGGVKTKFGVVLSLMKNTQEKMIQKLSEEVLAGIEYAVEEWEKNNISEKIILDVRDDYKDSTVLKTILEEFASDKDIVSVIGPLYSDLVAVGAEITNNYRLPLITPTANASGLTLIGNYIYQLNPDLEMHGRAIARYAVKKLGYVNLAVLAPRDLNIMLLVRNFSDEAQLLGANVVTEIYDKNLDDLREHFMNIRRFYSHGEPMISFKYRFSKFELAKMIRAGADPHLLDSMSRERGVISALKLFGARGKQIAESLNISLVQNKTSPENIEQPITSIDAIFLPIVDSDDIGMLISQLNYYNIQAQILGNSEWYDQIQLEFNKRDVDGAIFISDYYIPEEDTFYIKIKLSYAHKSKDNPGRYFFYGYDAMKLLLSALMKGARTRDSFIRILNDIDDFEGLRLKISLNKNRVNNNLHVLQFKDGQIYKVDDISVQ